MTSQPNDGVHDDAGHDDVTPASLSWPLLDAYLRGACTPDEQRLVEVWAEADPLHREELEQLEAAVHVSPHLTVDVTKAWETIAANVQTDRRSTKPFRGVPTTGSHTRNPRWPISRRHIGWGAVAAFGLIMAMSLYKTKHVTRSDLARTYHTAAQQRATVRLDDGSNVILAPSTSLVVTARGIEITGEAYFTVAPRHNRPFVVQTRNAVVQVLGTRFAVRQYPDDGQSRVVVEDGRVALHARTSPRSSDPGAVASAHTLAFVTDSGVSVTQGITPREYTSWTQGTLVFNRIPLRDVVVELSHTYGTDIQIADSLLASKTIVAEFDVEKRSLTQILDAISLSMDAHYVRDGKRFVLSRGRSRTNVLPEQQDRFPQPEKQYGR